MNKNIEIILRFGFVLCVTFNLIDNYRNLFTNSLLDIYIKHPLSVIAISTTLGVVIGICSLIILLRHNISQGIFRYQNKENRHLKFITTFAFIIEILFMISTGMSIISDISLIDTIILEYFIYNILFLIVLTLLVYMDFKIIKNRKKDIDQQIDDRIESFGK